MSKKILMILAEGFEEIEAIMPVDMWRRLGFEVTLAGLTAQEVTGAGKVTVKTDKLLSECLDLDFDAVALPGGMPGSQHLFESSTVIELLKKNNASGKVIAAICAAPMVLVKAGIITQSGSFTMYPSVALQKSFLPDGLTPSDERTKTIDNRIVTGRGPGAAGEFALAVAEVLGVPEAELLNLAKGMIII